MRIIGGEHRGRMILSPVEPRHGPALTRPITDRVKEALFNRLMARELTGGGFVLDLFAGTGSLGLEALSRGAEFCTFVERERSAVERLEKNLFDLRLTEQARVLALDIPSGVWLRALERRPLRIVFCDPPYKLSEDPGKLEELAQVLVPLAALTESGGVMVLRTESAVTPPPIDGWEGPVSHAYGSMTLHFYRRAGGERTES